MRNNILVLLSIFFFSVTLAPGTPPTPPPIAETPPPTAETPPPVANGDVDTSVVQTSAVPISSKNILFAITAPIGLFLLFTVASTVTVVLIIFFYLKRRKINRLKKDPTNKEIECANVIVNSHAISDRKDAENLPSEPIYSEIPALQMECDKSKQEPIGPKERTINGTYGHLVEGVLIDNMLYEELNQTIGNNGNSEISVSFVDPPNSPTELERNLNCSQIREEEIKFEEQISSGHFGIVYRATYHTQKGDIPVAVKSLKQAANSDVMLAFMREAATLAQFSHPNVLRLIGVLTSQHQQQPWMIVTELLRTELREFLLKLKLPNRNSSSSSSNSDLQLQGVVLHTLLLKFSQEIAEGMAYLTEKKFIHRDLAARNVLVAKDLTVRVADFGMSREIESPENNYYTSSGGRVPLRWTAPEALFYMKYSEKSDVWSFGVTLYEIWSLGDKPWGNASDEEVIQALSTGHILSAPIGCPGSIYEVMMRTWVSENTARPTFNELLNCLKVIPLID